MKDIHNEMGLARFLTTASTTQILICLTLTRSKTFPTFLTFWLVVVLNEGLSTTRMVCRQSVSKTASMITLGSALVSNIHRTERLLSDSKPTKVET